MNTVSILLPCLVPFFGGLGLPLGVPPLPETTVLAKIAPEDCLFYMSAAGTTTPDPASENQTEQLLAEPELQKLATILETTIKTNVTKAIEQQRLPPGTSTDDVMDLIALLFTRPRAVYVSDVQFAAGGTPTIRGAAVIHCGDATEKVKAKLEQYTKNLPPQMAEKVEINGQTWQSFKPRPDLTIACGFQHNYFLVALGEGEMATLLKHAGGKPPQWLTKIHQDLPVERIAAIAYLNVKAIREKFLPMAGPQAATTVEALGFGNVDALAWASGLNQKACVSKLLVSLDGEPRGVLRFTGSFGVSICDAGDVG